MNMDYGDSARGNSPVGLRSDTGHAARYGDSAAACPECRESGCSPATCDCHDLHAAPVTPAEYRLRLAGALDDCGTCSGIGELAGGHRCSDCGGAGRVYVTAELRRLADLPISVPMPSAGPSSCAICGAALTPPPPGSSPGPRACSLACFYELHPSRPGGRP